MKIFEAYISLGNFIKHKPLISEECIIPKKKRYLKIYLCIWYLFLLVLFEQRVPPMDENVVSSKIVPWNEKKNLVKWKIRKYFKQFHRKLPMIGLICSSKCWIPMLRIVRHVLVIFRLVWCYVLMDPRWSRQRIGFFDSRSFII